MFKQKTAYEIYACLVGSGVCIRDRCREAAGSRREVAGRCREVAQNR